jgi:hypothetical protein
MHTINLTEEERQLLIGIIEGAISETHSEIVHSQVHEYKEMLKERKGLLTNIMESLKLDGQQGG